MGVPTIGGQNQMPPTQMFLAQLIQTQQETNLLLATQVRLQLGQTAEDIERTLGVTFPVVSVEDYEAAKAAAEKSLADEMAEEMDRAAAEDGGELAGQVTVDEALAEPAMD